MKALLGAANAGRRRRRHLRRCARKGRQGKGRFAGDASRSPSPPRARCSPAPKDADKFGSDLERRRRRRPHRAARRVRRSSKARRARRPPAPAKASPKALADGKNLSALMRKSIALLRTPKGSPMPIKFMVLFNKANPKDLRLYLGPEAGERPGQAQDPVPARGQGQPRQGPEGPGRLGEGRAHLPERHPEAGPRQADPAVDPPADQGHRQGPDQALRRRGRRSRRQGRERRRAEGEPGRRGRNARRRQAPTRRG